MGKCLRQESTTFGYHIASGRVITKAHDSNGSFPWLAL